MKARWKAFFKGGAFFAVMCLAAKGIGAIYRIPLTGIMGAEGIGLYQMVFPLYSVLLTVSGGGLPSAISKTVAAFNAQGQEENARRTLNVSLSALSFVGVLGSLLLFLLRRPIAALQGNESAAIAYMGIAPAVALVSVISCFRGYFQGKLNMFPSGLSQITEQVVKLVVGLYLCSRFMAYGVEYAAFGALLGVSVSELAACIVLSLRYVADIVRHRKRTLVSLKRLAFEAASDVVLDSAPPLPYKSILKRVLAVALPITLGSLVLPLSSVIDSILVINLLTALGESVPLATKYYGILNGPVGSLVSMPTVVTGALSVMLLPKISRIASDKKSAAVTAEKFIRISLLAALPCALGLSLFSGEILGVLYRRTLDAGLLGVGSTLLKISSLTVMYMSLLQPATAVLQGYDRSYKPALNLLVGACVKAVLTIALIRVFGISGASIATVSCFALTCLLDVIQMTKVLAVRLDLKRTALAAIGGGAAFALIGKLSYFLLRMFLPLPIAVIAALALAAAAYAAAVFLLRGIKKEELTSFLGGDKKNGRNA